MPKKILNTKIDRYIFKELLLPFFTIFLFFSFIFLTAKILDITDIIINYNAKIWDVISLLFFMSPDFIYFILPIATMISILVTFIKLSSNNEIIAIKSSGVNINRMVLPVFIFCFINMAITGWLSFYGISIGSLASKNLLKKMAKENISIMVKPKIFNQNFGDLVIYAEKIDKDSNEMENIFIQEKKNTIVAPKGFLQNAENKTSITLRLFNGSISSIDIKDNSSNSSKFDTYNVTLNLLGSQKKKDYFFGKNEMSIQDLYRFIKNNNKNAYNYYYYLTYFYKKITIPIACLLLGLTSMFIALYRHKNQNQFVAIRFGLITIILYYTLMTLSETISEMDIMPVYLSMSIPNIAIIFIGFFFFIFAER